MDFVDGQDAARLLADRYPAGMPVEQVVRIVTAVASAVDYAHKQALLHRDVKPANIMVTHLDDDGEQRILLADFGIARDIEDISGLTTTNMTVGTVAYAPPEQLMGEEIDGRADQYALAATAYHLLTGSQLFPHSNPAVVISQHLNAAPPVLADTRPELAALDPVLAVALAKDPKDRFPPLHRLRTRAGGPESFAVLRSLRCRTHAVRAGTTATDSEHRHELTRRADQHGAVPPLAHTSRGGGRPRSGYRCRLRLARMEPGHPLDRRGHEYGVCAATCRISQHVDHTSAATSSPRRGRVSDRHAAP